MNDTVKQYPLTLTINTPMHTPRLRGLQAHGPHALGALGDNIRVRISRHDRDAVQRVCSNLGMSKAEFARWCTMEAVKALDTYVGGAEFAQPRETFKRVRQYVYVPVNSPPKEPEIV